MSWVAACAVLALFLGAGAAPSRATLLVVTAAGADVPRIELAARLTVAGLATSAEFAPVRENAARELAGRPDGVGAVNAAELAAADAAIARQVEQLQGGPPPSFCTLAHARGRPQIPGLRIVYLHPLGDPAAADRWRNIIAHQTEGPAGATRSLALAQFANPTKRGVMLWVETDGTVYWATAETAIPTQGDSEMRFPSGLNAAFSTG